MKRALKNLNLCGQVKDLLEKKIERNENFHSGAKCVNQKEEKDCVA
jgi:hypothetical protein